MAIQLHGRSLLTLFDLLPREIEYLLELAKDLKEKTRSGIKSDQLSGKSVVLIFNKPSTRTRCAFESAVFSEGGHVTFLANSHMGYKESIEDTAKVLGRYYDGIGYRGHTHQEIELLAQHAGIPVWNGLTDQHHPTQILADLMTARERLHKPSHRIKWVYVGDGRNNVAHSLLIGVAKLGMQAVILAPKSLWPPLEFLDKIKPLAHATGASIRCEETIDTAVKQADVIYTDVWVSMGEEAYWSQRIDLLKAYQVNQTLLEKTANEEVMFMHCLPAFHDNHTLAFTDIARQFGLQNMEVTDEVFQGRHSVVFEQAENRLHSLKAVILATIGNI